MQLLVLLGGALLTGEILNLLCDEIAEDKAQGIKRHFWEY
jgi:hypothetical protein